MVSRYPAVTRRRSPQGPGWPFGGWYPSTVKLPVPQFPPNGMFEVAPTETTPGSAAISGVRPRKVHEAASSLYFVIGTVTFIVARWLRIEPRAHALQPREAAKEQPGADEQRQRQRHLGDDENATQPAALPVARRTGAVLQRMLEIGARGVERRREPEDAVPSRARCQA